MAQIAEKVASLVKEAVEKEGVSLWDVRFLKEGAEYYLRIFIDKPGGVSIDDCTKVSRAIDPIIDEADPIDKSYYLEVCSAGLTRELTRDEHFDFCLGKEIEVKLFKALNGVKVLKGVLSESDKNSVTLICNGESEKIDKKNISKAIYEFV